MGDFFSVDGFELEYLNLSGDCTSSTYKSIKEHRRALSVLKLWNVDPCQGEAIADLILSYSSQLVKFSMGPLCVLNFWQLEGIA